MDLNTLLSLMNQGSQTSGGSSPPGSSVPISALIIDNLASQQTRPAQSVPLTLSSAADMYHGTEVPTSPSLLAASGVGAYVQLLGALSSAGSHEESTNLLTRSLQQASATLKAAYIQAAARLSPQLQAKDWRFSVSAGRVVFTKGQDELSPHEVVQLKQVFAGANVELPAKQVAAVITSMQQKRSSGADAGSLAWGQFEVDETNFGRIVDLRAYVTGNAPAGEYNPQQGGAAAGEFDPNITVQTAAGPVPAQTVLAQALAGQAIVAETLAGLVGAGRALVGRGAAQPGAGSTGAGRFGADASGAGSTAGASVAGQGGTGALVANLLGGSQAGGGAPAADLSGMSPGSSHPAANSNLHSDIPLTLGGMYLGGMVTSKPDFFKSDTSSKPEALLALEAPIHVEAGAILQGRCSCGEVRFTVEDEVEYAFYCHCARCRLRTGSAFAAIAGVSIDKVEVTSGDKSLLIEGECSDGYGARCSHCHTFLFAAVRGRQYLHISLGALAGAPSRLPDHHIYVGSKAPWFQITDGLPQYKELP